MYQHLRDKDDEAEDDEDDDGDTNHEHTKWSSNLQEMDGITAEHARVIEESDIIMTFLNNIGEPNSKNRTKSFRC